MPHDVLYDNPRLYRWILRLLPYLVVLGIASAGVGSWLVVDNIRANRHRSHQLAAQSARQATAIRLLCDRGTILDDLVLSILTFTARFPHSPGVPELRAALQLDHIALVDQNTRPGSPCNAG